MTTYRFVRANPNQVVDEQIRVISQSTGVDQ